MRKLILCLAGLMMVGPALAAGGGDVVLKHKDWSFSGPFGSFDQAAMQRGFQAYVEVCSGCHSLDYVSFRNLADLGYNEAEIKAIAAQYEVEDGPNDDGDMFCGLPCLQTAFQRLTRTRMRLGLPIMVLIRQTCL